MWLNTVLMRQTVRPGTLLRAARLRAGVSLRSLAVRIGVSPATLSGIENSKTSVTLDRMQAIAQALDTSIIDILQSPASTIPPSHEVAPVPSHAMHWRDFEPLSIDPVLTGAIEAFVRTGYHGATMRAIAETVGMSVPGVYHHYPSKQQLLVAALDLATSELHWRMPAARSDGITPTQRFANMVEALALFHTHRSALAFLGASEGRSLLSPNRERIAAQRSQIQYLLDDEIDAGLRSGEFCTQHPRSAGRAVATMCTSLPQWFNSTGPTSASEIARQYAEFASAVMRGG